MRASIIIPTNDRLDLLQRCVASIRRHTASDCEIIVVDNGSIDGTAAWCRQQGLAFVSLARNEGFPAACNRGLAIASGDTLVLLNNDTVVAARWLDNMIRALYSAPEIGIVGPVTNYASGRQQVRYEYADMEEFERVAEEVNVSDPDRWEPVERLVGICLAFRRELMERIGLLDVRFSPGHFEDDDYCYRARLEGYKLMICRDALIHHEGSASFGRDKEAQRRLVERNLQLFMDKWQFDPRDYV